MYLQQRKRIACDFAFNSLTKDPSNLKANKPFGKEVCLALVLDINPIYATEPPVTSEVKYAAWSKCSATRNRAIWIRYYKSAKLSERNSTLLKEVLMMQ
jgi:hypothetical protein